MEYLILNQKCIYFFGQRISKEKLPKSGTYIYSKVID